MRWICHAVCVCVVVIQVSRSLPLDQASLVTVETLDSIDRELGNPNSESSEREKRTIGVFRRIFPELSKTENPEDNALSGAESQVNEVRVPFPAAKAEAQDLETAASEDNEEEEEADGDEDDLEDADGAESEENTRSKRLGVFGNLFGGGGAGGSTGGGSGGGSGNFLFDIIRLVAGSGATEQADENANAPIGGGAAVAAGAPAATDDGYQAGIPGPITRLFVIANRGIANLLQDLILRLAQTSERIVNFKARLITAII